MSVQAMTWALEQTLVKDSSARHVLLCLANYADKAGRNAFPSTQSLAEDTGLSERTVRYKLDHLLGLNAIRPGNQAIARAHIERRDRTPVCYDLAMSRGAESAPRAAAPEEDQSGCKFCTSSECTGCKPQQDGVQISTERGAESAPKPSLNHQRTEEQLAGVDGWGRFAMFESWVPDADQLSPFLRLAMVPAEINPDHLRGFVAHYLALPNTVESSAGWCKRLAKWLRDEITKSRGAGQKRGSSAPTDDDFDAGGWLRGQA